ncbi:hypothetical protein ALQ60_101260 [Pseudomonas syringae pv. papulans]|nr:hypothetical protein ALO65_101343 [Pseudomonas syringae pv. papulans]RMN44196.1 hypothetical protein ALQ60_101260 [Pseudomonas syringae pv. papulans]RMN63233.1 hypothetical protein ALQ56_101778 [Pseudomonas syringae pv. papulans]
MPGRAEKPKHGEAPDYCCFCECEYYIFITEKSSAFGLIPCRKCRRSAVLLRTLRKCLKVFQVFGMGPTGVSEVVC